MKKNAETWKDVIGYEGLYSVSSCGHVKRIQGKILRPGIGSHGYPTVVLCKHGIPVAMLVHRLVAEAFLGPIPDDHEVDHVDRNRTNNRLENIRICTSQQNKWNSSPSGKSKFMGVCWHKKAKKWMSYISVDGKQKYLGLFNSETDAARARDQEAIERHSEHSYFNFPKESDNEGENSI